ncbi:MAG: RtcB family protein [Desulfatirhabdiaceae bacterium]
MTVELQKIDNYRWLIPKSGRMRVPGIVYSSEAMLKSSDTQESFKQVINVATLPGIVTASLAMPDMHWGYGFPIGGVAAFDWNDGIISPGGVGYDINCGVRLAGTGLTRADIAPRLDALINALYQNIPCGIGSTGAISLSSSEVKKVLKNGSRWALKQGLADNHDLDHTEDGGCISDADPDEVSDRALERGRKQLGTLGSGNHFLEIGTVDTIYQPDIARAFGLFEGQITLMLHSGSRGLGYQVCDDYLALMMKNLSRFEIDLPDRQLACAPIQSEEGRRYLRAMSCAANYAWANRQIMLHHARDVILKTLEISPRDLDFHLIYDVCHNIARRETHVVDGKNRILCVHRKGATRSFPAGHPGLNAIFQQIGQPVIVPGDMGTASYVLAGTQKAMDETFGSTCHGAGRVLSRAAAKKASRGRAIYRELENRGVLVRWTGKSTLAEEMPEAYKDVSEVVDVVHGAGISLKVAKLKPLAVLKG